MLTKKILFVTHSAQFGGAEIVLLSLAQNYRDCCHVLLLTDGPVRARLVALGVSVEVLRSNSKMLKVSKQGGFFKALGAVPAVLVSAYRLRQKAKGFDVVFPNSQKAAVISMLANLILGKPVIWYLHDILSAGHFNKFQRFLVVTLANLTARQVLTNSKASGAAFVACGGNKALVSIAPCGIDPLPFDMVSGTDARSARNTLKLSSVPLVGLFGRISPWKGQHILIEALCQITNVHAIIVGDALFGENDYKDELIELAKSLGVEDRVHWLGFRDDIPGLMRAVDIILHTSIAAEPFGRVIVEGMLARRPVIASADGASREILGEEYRFLVKPGDPSALAKAIADLLGAEQSFKDALAERNYARATSTFSPRQMFDTIDQALAMTR